MISRRVAMAGIGAGLALPWPAARTLAASAPVVVKIGIDERRVLVAAGVNGAGPFFFAIDSGATAGLIRDDFAIAHKLPAIAHRRIRGLGGAADAATFVVHDLVLGGVLDQHGVIFDSIDFGLGKDVVGALAAGAITSYDSVLDFGAGEWRIYRDGLPDLARYSAVDSRVGHPNSDMRESAYVFATVTVDGQAFNCLVDTGTPAALILHPQAVQRTRLWSDAVPYAPIRMGGVGGQGAVSRIVRARDVSIGPVCFDSPLIRLEGGPPGRFAADGIVGLELLQQLNLAIDTHHRRLLIARNGKSAPRERAPTSGMWVDQRGDRLVVADVAPGSPATSAGIVAGDLIVNTPFQALLRALGSGAGANVTLTIEHAGQRRRATLVLADYLAQPA